MKNLAKKSIGVLLILLFMFSTLSGCVTLGTNIGKQPYGDGNKESQRQDVEENNNALPDDKEDDPSTNHQPEADKEHIHAFEWVIDLEPTYTTPGVKHMECACGEKTADNTVVDRFLAEEITLGGMVDPTLGTYIKFKTKTELLNFCNDNKTKINKSLMCFDATSDFDKGLINLDELIFKPIYVFEYEIEDNGKYVNPLIIISLRLYVDEFAKATDDIPTGGTSATLVFYMEFYEVTETSGEIQFVFHKYNNPKSTMKYVIEVISDSKCVGNIFYYQVIDGEEISREWIAQYIQDGLYNIC